MGNIVYKVAPRHSMDNLVDDIKRIINDQHVQLEVLKNRTTIYCKDEPKLFNPLSDEYDYLEFLTVGDVVEVIFNFKEDDEEAPYENGIPFIGVITETGTGWYTSGIVSYEILVMNRSSIRYRNPELKERVTFEQDEVRDGIAKVTLLLRANPVSSMDTNVTYDHSNDTKEVI